jgi:hypothetical protein
MFAANSFCKSVEEWEGVTEALSQLSCPLGVEQLEAG